MRTGKYNAWRTEAGWMIQQQNPEPISGPVSIELNVADKGRADLGNLEKGVTDLLVSYGLIEGDGRDVVRKIVLQWAQDIVGCQVIVMPVEG